MKAYDFVYDNRSLSSFGMIVATFGSKGLETVTNGATIVFNTVPVQNGAKYRKTSTVYEDTLECNPIQICKHSCSHGVQEISTSELRELTKWLNRRQFLKLKILDEDHADLYYKCSFVSISRIEIDGKVYGLELQPQFNAPFAFKDPKTIKVVADDSSKVYGWEKYQTDPEIIKLGYVTSTNENAYPQGKVDENDNIIEGTHTDGYQYVAVGQVYKSSINDTSYEEGFIYPHTEITVNQSGNLKIYNAIENRETYISGCTAGEVITMDYPKIQSSISSHDIQNHFNWKFFRVANTYGNSRNDLVVSLPCTIKIEYSPIVKVGI